MSQSCFKGTFGIKGSLISSGSYPCAQGFNISSQSDIDTNAPNLEQCKDGWDIPDATFINIDSPTTDLAFPSPLWAKILSAVGVESLTLNLSGADAVKTLYMDDFYNGTLVLPSDPQDEQTVQTVVLSSREQKSEVEYQVHVYGNQTDEWNQSNGSYTMLHDIEHLESIYVRNAYVALFSLAEVGYLDSDNGNWYMPVLSVVSNATFSNHVFPVGLSLPLQVQGNITIQNNEGERFTGELSNGLSTSEYGWNIQSVGGNFVIDECSNASIVLSNLTSVGNQLSVRNSVNSTFAFSALASMSSLVMNGNGNSPILGDFRSLEFADSMELKCHRCMGSREAHGLGSKIRQMETQKAKISHEPAVPTERLQTTDRPEAQGDDSFHRAEVSGARSPIEADASPRPMELP
ncbi:hypothetical protein F4824DRAFT_504803 [Ustulina deusta]|nr:hypothetical protein F4824DRAFT_504803 [Ustulina deusta]